MSWIHESDARCSPESLAELLAAEPGSALLRSGVAGGVYARYSFVVARPFLTFRARGMRCELWGSGRRHVQFGNPWTILESLIARFELLDELDLPFPLGGCFGYWGYGLRTSVEPALPCRAEDDLELPDCHVGFYGSLAVFDHELEKTWIIATGLDLEGAPKQDVAREQFEFWRDRLRQAEARETGALPPGTCQTRDEQGSARLRFTSSLTRAEFIDAVTRAQRYIRSGDIYQVNLSQRFAVEHGLTSWQLYQRLAAVSPAPFSAYLNCGRFQIASSSPELFLRLSGSRITTRPIKGTRPRSADATRDTQLAYELQTSAKELAELVMITDLLRNDLGKVSEYGSVAVPELFRLERFAHVQHLVSTVEGRLRAGTSHLTALSSCFPGGSITGAPKIRAMEIIDELEPVARGPYTGAMGYIGYNRESQLSIVIRTAVCLPGAAYFHAGAGIVADSVPEAEYEETLDKARGFFQAMAAARTEGKVPIQSAFRNRNS